MREMRPSSWRTRLWAWLIDILLMSIPWHMVISMADIDAMSPAGIVSLAAMTFVYWTMLEGYRGQSLGKMIFNLMVVGSAGQEIGFADAAIESFGKAFLLPLDFLAGWVSSPKSGKRLFNRLSDTMVVDSWEGEV